MEPKSGNTLEIDPYIEEAHSLVDTVISNALINTQKYLSQDNIVVEEKSSEKNIEKSAKESPSETNTNITWLTGEEFSIQKGQHKIEEFVKTWKRDDSWLYCIDFLDEEEHDCDVRYRYRVRWSVPTRRKPIPKATASVYFTIKVSKFKPKSFPVDVYYIFETNRLVHRPGESIFRQKWLKDIIDSKIELMKSIKF